MTWINPPTRIDLHWLQLGIKHIISIIMPILMNLFASILLGSATAVIARESRAMRENWLSWSSLAMLAFQALCITPMATYAFRFYPDWSMLYLLDPEIFPRLPYWVGWLSLIVIALNFGAATVAYLLSRRAILQDSHNWALIPIISSLVALGTILIIFHERVFFVGDYEAFLAGEAIPIIQTIVGISGMVVYCLGIGFLTWLNKKFSDSDPKLF